MSSASYRNSPLGGSTTNGSAASNTDATDTRKRQSKKDEVSQSCSTPGPFEGWWSEHGATSNSIAHSTRSFWHSIVGWKNLIDYSESSPKLLLISGLPSPSSVSF